MADKSLSELDQATNLTGTEFLYGTQSGNSKKLKAKDIADLGTSADNIVESSSHKIMTSAERTKLAGISAGADVTSSTNVAASGATMNTDSDVSGNAWVLNENTLATNSTTKVATQGSVKSYVDSNINTKTATKVDGPASAIDGNLAAFDGTTGKKVKDSGNKASDFMATNFGNAGVPLPDSLLSSRLGVDASSVTDWNSAVQSGFYTSNPGAANAPDSTSYFLGTVRSRATGVHTVQDLTAIDAISSNTKTWRRHRYSGAWAGWFSVTLSTTEQASLWTARADLSSTAASKGASLVGVQDSAGYFTGTTVEAVLNQLGYNDSVLSSTKAGFLNSANASETNFPIGSYILVQGSVQTVNAGVTLYLSASNRTTAPYTTNSSGNTPLVGVWRSCGGKSTDGGSGDTPVMLFRRTS